MVEVHKVRLEGGDQVLLCSDGLTGMVGDEEINHILKAEAEPERSCRQLVELANKAGGKDNITVVVAQFRAVNPAETPIREHAPLAEEAGPGVKRRIP
jgi:protein phosphatase